MIALLHRAYGGGLVQAAQQRVADAFAQERHVVGVVDLVTDDLKSDVVVFGVVDPLAVDGDALPGRFGDEECQVEAGEHARGEGLGSGRTVDHRVFPGAVDEVVEVQLPRRRCRSGKLIAATGNGSSLTTVIGGNTPDRETGGTKAPSPTARPSPPRQLPTRHPRPVWVTRWFCRMATALTRWPADLQRVGDWIPSGRRGCWVTRSRAPNGLAQWGCTLCRLARHQSLKCPPCPPTRSDLHKPGGHGGGNPGVRCPPQQAKRLEQ